VNAPVDGAEGPSPGPSPTRPLTVALLAGLWALSAPLYVITGFALAWQMRGAGRAATAVAGLALAVVAAVMAVGLWQGRRWSHHVQLAVAVLGLFLCPFTLASIAVLVYMLRPSVRWHFSSRSGPEPEGGKSEPVFAGALLAAVVLGVLLTGGLTLLARTGWTGNHAFRRTPGEEGVALDQLKAVAAAEDAFHSVCNTGYGDLKALREPASVIADYPADGPAFLRGPSFDEAERDGYRYALTVSQEMPAVSGCPTRRFRHFVYSATPLGAGRSLAVSSDGVVRAAEGRAATPDDAPAE
jgi:hypothetical protein